MASNKNNFWKRILLGMVLVLLLGTVPKYFFVETTQAYSLKNLKNSKFFLFSQVNPSQLIEQGRKYYQLQDYSEAIKVWQQASNIYESRSDKLNLVIVSNYLGLAYLKLGQLSAAEKAITFSLELLDSLDKKNLSVLAQTFNTQGSLQLAQGKVREAIFTWQKATRIYQQIGDEQGEIGSLINQSQAMQNLGLYVQAQRTLDQVKAIIMVQKDDELKVIGLQKLGNFQRDIGNFKESIAHLQEALKIAESLSYQPQISSILLDLGNTATVQKEYQTALEYYQKVIELSPDSGTKIKAQLNQIKILIETEEYPQAISLSLKIKPQFDSLSFEKNNSIDRLFFLKSLIQLQSYIKSNNLSEKEVINFAHTTLKQAQSVNDQKSQAIALGYLGTIYEQNQQWTKAHQFTQKALSLAQYLNAEDIIYQWYWQLGRIEKAQGNLKAATVAYQQAFNNLQSLRRNSAGVSGDIQFSFRESIEPVYRELVDLLLTNSDNSVLASNKLQQSRQIIESLRIIELENFFRSNCLEEKIVPVDNIPQTNAAIIYPIILPNRIEVILSLPQQPLTHFTTYVSESEANQTLQQLSLSLRKPFTAPEGKVLGKQVYDWLIQPLENQLTTSQISNLIFVLDGELANIPMAALYDGQNYLIEKYSVGLAPGLQLLDPKPLQEVKLEALVAGLSEARHGFIALENVQREIKEINAQLPSEVLINRNFTSTALQNQLANIPYSIVHLASHGQFSSNPDETFIVAWDKPIKVKELNNLLRQSQQTEDKVLELLVLSACETATGDKKAALGLAGVALQAGARSTLATLWTVSDEATAEFMSQFYRLLSQEHLTKTEALRQAQLFLLNNPSYDTPYLWAAFVLLGNWL